MQVFGLTLVMALEMCPVHRPLSVVELWCGVASIAGAAQKAGQASVAMDKNRVPGVTNTDGPDSENILSKHGFMRALQAVLEIKEGGLLWMAPVCSSWVFMNSANCRRTVKNPAGRAGYEPVKQGNHMASIAAFLYAVAMLRKVRPVIEQPAGSIMFRFKPIETVFNAFGHCVATCARCAFQIEAPFGARFLKRYKFAGESWVQSLRQKCECPNGDHKALVKVDEKSSKTTVSGDQALLKESQSYPPLMGKWVVDKWLEQRKGQGSPLLHGPPSTVSQPSRGTAASPSWKRPPTSSTWKTPPAGNSKRQKLQNSNWKRPMVSLEPGSSSWKRCTN